MGKRKKALKLYVASPTTRTRPSRLQRIRAGDWILGRTSQVRAATKRPARPRQDETSHEGRLPDRDVLELDSTAFVEALAMPASGTIYRLHSADHYVNCSRAQYERLSGLQRTTPVLLTARKRLRWWWYRERFWWVDRRLGADEIESRILAIDLASRLQRESFEQAQAGLFGPGADASTENDLPESVRREVWIRDRGRCVDCGIESSLSFDYVLELAVGGTNTAANLELRCRQCQIRRRANEGRATVGKARIGARAAKEWEIELKDLGWPRPTR